ncbi:RES domain-containing protein [Acidipila sp. EB88]|nr:RES domain-containing protein [Acidipila sp. EB88]
MPLARYVPPVTVLERVTASRLLPARYSDSVLTRLADSDEDLQVLYALDNATNERLLAEHGNRAGLAARELALGVPSARIINAAFAHPHPLGARFSTPFRGAWYAAFELATAKAEVLFHRDVQLREIHWDQPEILDYDQYQANFAGSFHDLRSPQVTGGDATSGQVAAEAPEASVRLACLQPDSYVTSQQLAVHLLEIGSQGVLYPSIRRPGGTCLACFQPKSVQDVRKRDLHRLTWYPDSPATFARVARQEGQTDVLKVRTRSKGKASLEEGASMPTNRPVSVAAVPLDHPAAQSDKEAASIAPPLQLPPVGSRPAQAPMLVPERSLSDEP